jgi:hypothetical protein
MSEELADKTLEEQKEGPKDARPYHKLLEAAEKQEDKWHKACDKAATAYASLDRLVKLASGDSEFQIFWANMEVIKPSVYARPPVPIVTPAFKERDPLVRTASEVMERLLVANMRKTDGHKQLCLVRDDLTLDARGVLWVEHETSGYNGECALMEHLLRQNFRHDPQANWQLVNWVARAGFFTEDEAKKRWKKVKWEDVDFKTKDIDTPDEYDVEKKVKVWQIWDKRSELVTWVAEGCEEVLDQGPPPVKLRTFWPCPEPAYATKEPNSLTPVPDWLFYADQVEEINRYTRRINNLVDQLKLKGFYEAGGEEVATALSRALKSNDDKILVPITGLSAIDGNKDLVQWLPLDKIIQAVSSMVEIRAQLIQDVYEITGISDIMRGQTQASETLGAQQLKTQYGNVRIRSRQEEMVRIGHEALEIAGEIAAENFKQQSLIDMTRVNLPTQEELEEQVRAQLMQIEQQALQQADKARKQPPAPPQPGQPPQEVPDPMEVVKQAEQKLKEQMSQELTWEKVVEFLRTERLNAFAMDIETDSTIQADEQQEKQNRTEFTTAVTSFLSAAGELVAGAPETGPLVGELLQFATAPYRPGRQMESTIDELVEKLNQKAKAAAEQQGGPSPEEIEAQANAKKLADEGEAKKAEAAAKATQEQQKAVEADFKRQEQAKENEAKRLADAQAKKMLADAEVERHNQKAAADDKRAEREHRRRLGIMKREELRAIRKHDRELELMERRAADDAAKAQATEQNSND